VSSAGPRAAMSSMWALGLFIGARLPAAACLPRLYPRRRPVFHQRARHSQGTQPGVEPGMHDLGQAARHGPDPRAGRRYGSPSRRSWSGRPASTAASAGQGAWLGVLSGQAPWRMGPYTIGDTEYQIRKWCPKCSRPRQRKRGDSTAAMGRIAADHRSHLEPAGRPAAREPARAAWSMTVRPHGQAVTAGARSGRCGPA
jgi:hypothetical protein